MEEIWKPIIGYKGIYSVSNLGKVRRENSVGHGTHKGKILKPAIDNHGYKLCILSKNKKKSSQRIHKLVAITFIGERPHGFDINHIDGNKLNNSPKNLEYISSIENVKHAWKIGLMKGPSGSINGNAKLIESSVLKIREEICRISRSKLAQKYGVHPDTITSIVNRHTWTHI